MTVRVAGRAGWQDVEDCFIMIFVIEMAEAGCITILITAGSYEEARKIAEILVGQRTVACVNIVPKVKSLFRWRDRVEEAEESLLIAKTRAELFPEIMNLVKQTHSYEVPEIIALPITQGNPDYLSWISKETR